MEESQNARLFHIPHMDVERLEGRTLLSVASFDGPYNLYANSVVDRSGITQGPDGRMWLIDPQADRIRSVSADGEMHEFTFPGAEEDERLDLGSDIAAGADGKIWFAVRDESGWRMARISTAGELELVSTGETSAIEHVEAGADGGVWFSRFGGTIARMDHASLQITLVDAQGVSDVFDLEAAPDGSIWFTGFGHISPDSEPGPVGWISRYDVIGKISLPGVVEQFRTTGFSLITDIVAAADGFLYFGANDAIGRVSADGQIERIALPGIRAVDLTMGADGGLWFVDVNDPLNPLATLGDDGSLTRFSARGPAHQIHALAAGADGTLWYTTGSDNAIRRFNPDAKLGGRAVRLNAEHKVRFSQVVASFTDWKDPGSPSDYEAIIDWGNGETTAGVIVRSDALGDFNVIGENKLKWGWHTLRISITDLRGDAGGTRDLTIHSVAYVIPTSIAGKGRTIEPTAGQTFRGTVATYIGPDVDDLGRYKARINWGDHESSAGQLVVGGNGEVKVVGVHVYLRPGQYDIYVTLEEVGAMAFPTEAPSRSPASSGLVLAEAPYSMSYRPISPFNDARSRAVVKPGIVDGDLVVPRVHVGERFDKVIARFETTEDQESISHYRAVIDLGDRLIDGVIEAVGDRRFEVRLSHVFTDSSDRPVTVRIYDERRPESFGTIGVVAGEVGAHTHLNVEPDAISATAGVEFDGKVGRLVSLGSDNGDWDSEFHIIIHWGDGATSPGRLIPRGGGLYDVFGTHTYEVVEYHRELELAIEVRETRRGAPGLPAGPFDYRTVEYAGWSNESHIGPGQFNGLTLRRPRFQPHGAQAGLTFSMHVATMTVGDRSIPISEYHGVVKWDDGTESVVSFALSGEYDDVYHVLTTHTFAASGARVGVVTVSGAGDEEFVQVSLYVQPPTQPPRAPVARVFAQWDLQAVDEVQFGGVVGKFLPRDPGALPSDFTLTLRWGDGLESAGVLEATQDGWIIVHAEHLFHLTQDNTGYVDERFSIIVKLGDESSAASGRVIVSRNPDKLYADGRSMHFRQRQEFTSKVATFTSPKDDATPEEFEAWIEWGDGTRTRGVITRGHRDTFEVAGTHTYASRGSGYLIVKVTVSGPGGTDVATSQVRLDPDPVVVTPTKPDVDGLKISGRLATFIDEEGSSADPQKYRVFYAALIDWGDGQVTFGIVGERADGSYDVIGSHEYREAGQYTVSLVVRRNTRYLPELPRWIRRHHRSHDGLVFTDLASAGNGRDAAGRKDEFAKVLFTIRVKKAKKDAPPNRDDRRPRCRKGEKPKRDNCRAVQKKKKRSGQIRPSAATSWFKASLFGRTRIGQAHPVGPVAPVMSWR